MSSNPPDESVIREYLLGTLPEQDWDAIEEKLLSDKEFADFVDSIEDEIIEEYLTIHNHFLRPPERQRKLLFASVLRSKLQRKQQLPVPIDLSRRLPAAQTSRPYWAALAGVVAVLLLSTAPLAVYTASLHRDLEVAKSRTNNAESMLAQASRQVASLHNELELRDNPGVIVFWPLQRDIQKLHPFQATSNTKSLEIDIHLNPEKPSSYHVDLLKNNGESGYRILWSQDNLHPAGDVLVFRIPYFGQGSYSLRVTGNGQSAGAPADIYHFNAVEAPSPASKQ
jgi:hypothetical protein